MVHLFPMSKQSVYHSSKSIPQLHFCPYFFTPQMIATIWTFLCSVASLSIVSWVHATQTVLSQHTWKPLLLRSSMPCFLSPNPSFPPTPHAHIKKLIFTLDITWPNSIIWPQGSWFYSWSFWTIILSWSSTCFISCSLPVFFGSYFCDHHLKIYEARTCSLCPQNLSLLCDLSLFLWISTLHVSQ